MFIWSEEQPVGMGLPAVLEVNTGLKDVSPLPVAEFFTEQAKEPLCLTAREKVGDGKTLFDVNCNGILVHQAPLDEPLQWYVPESLQDLLLYLSHYPRYAGHHAATKMYTTLRRNNYWLGLGKYVFQTVRDCRMHFYAWKL